MVNERITENIVRNNFRKTSIYGERVLIEEQKSSNPRIDELLQNASKSGDGKGKPEFLISIEGIPDLLIVVECKADILKHESEKRDKYKDYAVDGVLLYSSYLSKGFNVLSLAVSGEEEDNIKVSYFIQNKNKTDVERIFGNKLITLDDMISGLNQEEKTRKERYEDLLEYSKTLNTQLHKLKIKEDKRSLLVSGILLSLESSDFYRNYISLDSPKILANTLVETIKEQLQNEDLQNDKVKTLMENYSFIKSHPSLTKKSSNKDLKTLKELIDDIDENINGYARTYKYYDVLGQFYIEFLKYSNSDKGLGIVLTPPHITDFFVSIADIREKDIIYDNCTGTSGFLVSSMKTMIEKAMGDSKTIQNIKSNQLFGCEYQPEIYPLAVSNMFLHGDGKSNILNGNCFDEAIISKIKTKKPTKGLLNPPYKSDKKNDKEEWEFILNSLECLEKHGICVAIIPTGCVLAQKGKVLRLKEELLNKHTLKAVFSMPIELFNNSNVSVITSVVVIEAKIPHNPNKETFLGYFVDDGFTKKKTKGRFDYYGKWDDIQDEWLDLYFNNKTKKGISVAKKLLAEDEWCAEAYMETDYSKLQNNDFIKQIHNYVSFLFSNKHLKNTTDGIHTPKNIKLKKDKWSLFYFDELFEIEKGRELADDLSEDGNIPLVSATRDNNGIKGYVDVPNKKFEKQVISVVANGASTGEAFYHDGVVCATTDVNILIPKFDTNIYVLMFIITMIRYEKYRFNYSRKWGKERMKNTKINLPINEDNLPDWQFMEEYIKSLPYSSNL